MWDGVPTLRSDLSLYSGLVQATGGGSSHERTILLQTISLFHPGIRVIHRQSGTLLWVKPNPGRHFQWGGRVAAGKLSGNTCRPLWG